MKEIKIGFIYQENNVFLTGNHFDNTYYHFFMNALQRNDKLIIKNFPVKREIDCDRLKGKVDAILLWENSSFGMPEKILNIDKLDVPVISRVGDPNRAKDSIDYHEKWKITHYFHFVHKDFFMDYIQKNLIFQQFFLV